MSGAIKAVGRKSVRSWAAELVVWWSMLHTGEKVVARWRGTSERTKVELGLCDVQTRAESHRQGRQKS